jgi:hypothetical protein
MPSVITYIREEDYPKYLSIKSVDKGAWSVFVHRALNTSTIRIPEKLTVENFEAVVQKTADYLLAEPSEFDGMFFDTKLQMVRDEETGEPLPSDAGLIKDLKAAGKVK